MFKPAETISEIVHLCKSRPATCHAKRLRASSAAPPLWRLLQLLPERQLWNLFLKSQGRRPHYLKPGDRTKARIWSRDKALDLGEQITELVA